MTGRFNFPENAESFPEEVDVEFSAHYLGVSPRTIVNYLKTKQLLGVKVGKKWFIKKEGLLKIRPFGQTLKETIIPDEENPLSAHQEKMRSKNKKLNEWELKKRPKKTPLGLLSFGRAKESLLILEEIKEELEQDNINFYKEELLSIVDDLSAGFYSFGLTKRKLYGRARVKAGRITGRALVQELPQGFNVSLMYLVESIARLCHKMEDRIKVKDNE